MVAHRILVWNRIQFGKCIIKLRFRVILVAGNRPVPKFCLETGFFFLLVSLRLIRRRYRQCVVATSQLEIEFWACHNLFGRLNEQINCTRCVSMASSVCLYFDYKVLSKGTPEDNVVTAFYAE